MGKLCLVTLIVNAGKEKGIPVDFQAKLVNALRVNLKLEKEFALSKRLKSMVDFLVRT